MGDHMHTHPDTPSELPERRRRRGGAAIEFGLWLPVMLTIVSGITDVSWMMSRYHQVVRAARDGARVGVSIVEDEDTSYGTKIKAAAEAHAEAILDGVGMPCDDRCSVKADIVTNDGLDYLEVDVTYRYDPLLGMLPLQTDLNSRFVMMLQQQD